MHCIALYSKKCQIKYVKIAIFPTWNSNVALFGNRTSSLRAREIDLVHVTMARHVVVLQRQTTTRTPVFHIEVIGAQDIERKRPTRSPTTPKVVAVTGRTRALVLGDQHAERCIDFKLRF